MVVLTADHGEGMRLPRHHGSGHGDFVYRSTVEVPWVVHHPSLDPHTVDQLSMNVNVLPTLLDLVGLPEQAAAATDAGDTELAEEDADVQEALEALGYVE